MRRTLVVLAVLLVAAACDGPAAPAEPGSSSTAATSAATAVTTTTIDPEQACRDVADRLADLLESVLDELDGLDAATFTERSRWPEDLLRLEAAGVELDREAAALGCDPGALQTEALAAVADREPRSLLSRWLLELLTGEAG